MKKLATFLAVSALCAFAFAIGEEIDGPWVQVDTPGPPPQSNFYQVFPGTPHNSISFGTVTFTFDPETGKYKAPSPNGDSLSFEGGVFTFEDWPPPPQLGPPLTKTGTYTDGMGQ